MESIIEWLHMAFLRPFPEVDLTVLPGRANGKLKLGPEQLLAVIHGPLLAEWALQTTALFQAPRLSRGPGGRPTQYHDPSILLMAVIQTVWRKSYEQIVDWVANSPPLAQALGFTGPTISQGHYWERRRNLGVLPLLLFFWPWSLNCCAWA